MRYSIDTSAILGAWRRSYPPDAFPGFWENLDELIRRGSLRASEAVRTELEKDDEVLDWAKKREKLFVPIDQNIQLAVKQILGKHPRLVDTRKGRSGADPFVIALARVNGCKVVTDETSSGNLTKPRIPDVCLDFGIHFVSVLQLIRERKWIFRS